MRRLKPTLFLLLTCILTFYIVRPLIPLSYAVRHSEIGYDLSHGRALLFADDSLYASSVFSEEAKGEAGVIADLGAEGPALTLGKHAVCTARKVGLLVTTFAQQYVIARLRSYGSTSQYSFKCSYSCC